MIRIGAKIYSAVHSLISVTILDPVIALGYLWNGDTVSHMILVVDTCIEW